MGVGNKGVVTNKVVVQNNTNTGRRGVEDSVEDEAKSHLFGINDRILQVLHDFFNDL